MGLLDGAALAPYHEPVIRESDAENHHDDQQDAETGHLVGPRRAGLLGRALRLALVGAALLGRAPTRALLALGLFLLADDVLFGVWILGKNNVRGRSVGGRKRPPNGAPKQHKKYKGSPDATCRSHEQEDISAPGAHRS
jgi:hypothetical protein